MSRPTGTDERTAALARALGEAMDRETEVFDGLAREVARLRDALQARAFSSALALAEIIERAGTALAPLDDAREAAFVGLRQALGRPAESTFSSLLPSLPTALRADLEDRWRRLRMAVVRLRTAATRMRYSAEALAGTLDRILERVHPYRKGKIYSRRGTPTSVGGAVLVDRSL